MATSITATVNHSLGAAKAKQLTQQWLDYNFMWPSSVRLNGLTAQWTSPTTLQFKGKVGTTRYVFNAILTITPTTISLSATSPPTLYIGAQKGWQDELNKIVNGILPPRIVVNVTHSLGLVEAKNRLNGWVQAMSGGKKEWRGDQVLFYYLLKGKDGKPKAGWQYGEAQVYAIATVTQGAVQLETRDTGAVTRKTNAKQWEDNLLQALATPVPGSASALAQRKKGKRPGASSSTPSSSTTAPGAAASGGGGGGMMLALGAALLLMGGKKGRR